ncbi:hypothetical protein [Caballeronia sp. LZ035]|uniref:hypothetical protein n=1 Tax=Caballeronia sp. LZ035 TaxID=3038568 RepID=UPI00285A240F|nr:hypothetical protein [Caballeronia sp. LZ035]MDR5757648.1 hypothetical protein [Caballeronia sp. LZ035]
MSIFKRNDKTEQDSAAEPQGATPMPNEKVIETRPEHGPVVSVTIRRFSAFEGWEAAAAAIDYMTEDDEAKRTRFRLNILSTATVNGQPLNSPAAINEAFKHWASAKYVFDQVLAFNEIDQVQREFANKSWDAAGARVAMAFAAHTESMLRAAEEAAQTIQSTGE